MGSGTCPSIWIVTIDQCVEFYPCFSIVWIKKIIGERTVTILNIIHSIFSHLCFRSDFYVVVIYFINTSLKFDASQLNSSAALIITFTVHILGHFQKGWFCSIGKKTSGRLLKHWSLESLLRKWTKVVLSFKYLDFQG